MGPYSVLPVLCLRLAPAQVASEHLEGCMRGALSWVKRPWLSGHPVDSSWSWQWCSSSVLDWRCAQRTPAQEGEPVDSAICFHLLSNLATSLSCVVFFGNGGELAAGVLIHAKPRTVAPGLKSIQSYRQSLPDSHPCKARCAGSRYLLGEAQGRKKDALCVVHA